MLITTLLAGKDSGAAESFSEGHLWLTVPARPCHPGSMANEQTQGFSLRFIIVTINEFQVLSVVVLHILSSHQPVNQPSASQTKKKVNAGRATRSDADTPRQAQKARAYAQTENQIS